MRDLREGDRVHFSLDREKIVRKGIINNYLYTVKNGEPVILEIIDRKNDSVWINRSAIISELEYKMEKTSNKNSNYNTNKIK